MHRIFLYAYDKRNLGDDLFVHTITKRYPHVKFYMWSDSEKRQTFRCLPNLKILPREGRLVRFLNWMRPSFVARYRNWRESRCQAVVYIGGSIFIEYEHWAQYLTWWEYMVEHHNFYVMGANFGPYYTDAYREKIGQIYGKMKDVCFRDQYSYELFRQVKTVRQAPDILFSYPMPQVSVKEKQIFVSVIDCTGRSESYDLAQYNESYVENMARLLEKYRRQGYRLVLSSFCRAEGDEECIQKLLKVMDAEDAEDIELLHYDGTNADAVVAAIAQSEYVVGTRFHAIMLAIVAGRPVLPIVYSDKTIHVLKDLGFEGPMMDLRTCENFEAQPATLLVDREKLAQEAQKHFEKLDEILK